MKKSLIILLSAITCCLLLTACGDPQLKVNYTIDGKKTEELPSQGLYEIKSIKCSNKKANATWDCNSWSLKTEPLTKNTTVDLDFTYTSHPFTMNGMGFDDLQSAFNAVPEGSHADVHLTKDASGAGITPVGSDITLHMNGFTLDGEGSDTIVNCGTLEIIGDGKITNTTGSGENSKSLVNYGTLSAENINIENTTPSFSVWNSNNGQSSMTLTGCTITRTEADIITIVNSGVATLSGCTITGGGDLTHPAVLQNDGKASLEVTGSTITNTGSGYSIHRESGTVNVDGTSTCPNSYGY
ncbi:MAG: hypothetical protein IKO32_01530 [Lachnospiraceae bacterium]|nr:hypothetical protein [Lachnospiraceae bacterium]